MEPRIVEAEPLLQIEQLVRLLLREVVDAAKLPREHQNAAVGVEDFRLPKGLFERLAETHRAVVLQDDAARPFEERKHRVGELLVRPASRRGRSGSRP